jgi:hypothetical protein
MAIHYTEYIAYQIYSNRFEMVVSFVTVVNFLDSLIVRDSRI